jgi:phosphoribosylformylglycinamidine cyclo-ligase
VLVSTTDGVGTKSAIARMTGRFDTIGIDLVAMSVDDLVVQGAEPLFFLDYISVGKLDPARMEALVSGVADGCRQARCAIIGGEMSEHPGIMQPDEFDLVGFAVGIVDRARMLPRDVQPGDVLLGIESPGLRCNGYSLARAALLDRAGRDLDEPAWPGADTSLGDELLRPSVIYAPALLSLLDTVPVHAFAHITGGGIAANLARVLPADCDATVTRGTWPVPPIFDAVQQAGSVADAEMERVCNLGVGMMVVLPPDALEPAIAALAASGHASWRIGQISAGSGRAALIG